MDAKSVIKQVKEEKNEIRQVYWVACGGSLVDLYPAHCMVMAESALVESGLYTSKEFILATPKKLGEHSLVVLCSHSGGTKETLDAAELSLSRGAAVVMMTNHPASPADSEQWISWVYPWGDHLKTSEIPSGISLSIAAELLASQETFEAYDALMDGIEKWMLLWKRRRFVSVKKCVIDLLRCARSILFFIFSEAAPALVRPMVLLFAA